MEDVRKQLIKNMEKTQESTYISEADIATNMQRETR